MTALVHSGDDERGEATAAPEPLRTPAGSGPLHRLVQQRMRERSWSYADVARRSGLPRSTVHHLATAPTQRPPRASTVEALARGLDLPRSVVQGAVAEAAGLSLGSVPVDHDTAVLIASIEELSPQDRQHVSALIASLRNRSGGSGAHSRS